MKAERKLTSKQEKLIGFLITERTIERACERAGVSTVTYWRWMREPEFERAYREARRDIVESTVARLQGATAAAVDALERNLDCENPSVQVRAATIILETSMKGVELLEVAERLSTLEAAVDHSKWLEGLADEFGTK